MYNKRQPVFWFTAAKRCTSSSTSNTFVFVISLQLIIATLITFYLFSWEHIKAPNLFDSHKATGTNNGNIQNTFGDVQVQNYRFGSSMMLRRRGRSKIVATFYDVLTQSSNHSSNDVNQPLPTIKFDENVLNRENSVNPPPTPTIVEDNDCYYRTRSMKHGIPQIPDQYETTSFENINVKSIMTRTCVKDVTHTNDPTKSNNLQVLNTTIRSCKQHPRSIHKAASKKKHKRNVQLQLSIKLTGEGPLSNSHKSDRRTSSRITGNSARLNNETIILPFHHVTPVTEESSFSDQSSVYNSSDKMTGLGPASDQTLQSKLPKRIRVIKNVALDTGDIPLLPRPKRRRIPTDFYSPSDLSVIFKFETKKPVTRKSEETFDIDQTPIKSNKTENTAEVIDRKREYAVMTSTDAMSYNRLLWEYDQLVAQGRCHQVSFGSTLPSALLEIERTLQKLKNETNNSDIVDDEIMADVREYKRSLRAFSVYEDREKLALVHEVQEKMELWGRQCATANKWNYYKSNDRKFNDNDQCTESSMLKNRPIVISNSNRIFSRNTFKCKDGANCIFQCNKNTSGHCCDVIFTPNDIAPIPTVEPFHIDDGSEMMMFLSPTKKCQWNTASSTNNILSTSSRNRYNKTIKSKFTVDALTELKNSLHFIETYRRGAAIFAVPNEAK